MSEQKYAAWNPWHGCTNYSEGCRYCYVYRQDEAYGSPVSSEQCRKTQNFYLPVKKKGDGSFKVEARFYCYDLFYLGFSAEGCGRMAWGMLGNDKKPFRLYVLFFYKAN